MDVIVHALNPNYARWDALLPPVTSAVIAIAKASGGMLMVPGNVYNFGTSLPLLLSETTPFSADTGKAALRIQMEQTIAAAAAEQGFKSVVIRAGDFIGGSGTWLDMAITKSLDKGMVTSMGPDNLAHAWAYLPDLAEVFVRVAEQRSALTNFQVLHYPGITASGSDLHAALEAITGRKLKIQSSAMVAVPDDGPVLTDAARRAANALPVAASARAGWHPAGTLDRPLTRDLFADGTGGLATAAAH
ncbi:hypothetical protein ACFS07_17955 [Undibacterium arcticum]